MQAPTRLSFDCSRCENRGVIILDDDTEFPCPHCNCWCAFCLEERPGDCDSRPHMGVLVAGARRSPDGDILFEGYACDVHKMRLRNYSFITPRMLGRFVLGAAYLARQWGCTFVELYGYGEAANWEELEDEARQAVALQGRSPYGMDCYDCPPELAIKARRAPGVPEHVRALLAGAAREEGKGREEVKG